MSKNLSLLILMTFLFSCKNDPPPAAKTPPPAATQTASPPSAEPQTMAPALKTAEKKKTANQIMAELQANSFDAGDIYGRAKHSIELIQKQFDLSNNLRKKDGKRFISMDEKFNITIKYEQDGELMEIKANLKNIDHRNGGIHLIPDKELDDWPGFSVGVLAGKPGVEIFKDGKKAKEERELKIFMADRTLIEQAVPAMMQALNVVHGRG